MSADHKPEDQPEMERIEKAGGRVTPDGRVNGGLNLSRALGDHAYKTNKELPLQVSYHLVTGFFTKTIGVKHCSGKTYNKKFSNPGISSTGDKRTL